MQVPEARGLPAASPGTVALSYQCPGIVPQGLKNGRIVLKNGVTLV
jgi:hypothetical protein